MESERHSHDDQISNFLPQNIIEEIDDSLPKDTEGLQTAHFDTFESQSTKCNSSYNILNLPMSMPMRNPMSSSHLRYNPICSNEQKCPNRRIGSENQLKTFKMIPQLMPTMNPYNPYLTHVDMTPHRVLPLSMNYLSQYPPNMSMTLNQGVNLTAQMPVGVNQGIRPCVNMAMVPNTFTPMVNFINPRTVKSQQTVIPQPKQTMIQPTISDVPKKPGKRKSTSNVNSQLDIESLLSEMTITQIIEKTGPTFIKLIKTNKGSRYLQKIMKKISSAEIEVILETILEYLVEIMCDYYGNYFLQEYLPCCNPQQRLLIYHKIKNDFAPIASDLCGTHSLQSLIMLLNTKEEELVIKECIESNLLQFSNDSSSTHIIQKVIASVNEANRDYLNNFIISNLIDLCFNPNGICVVKSFIQHTVSDSIAKAIITIFELETVQLTEDQYGNFGVQEAIRKYGDKQCSKIVKKIIDHIVRLASQKFSSNVIDFLAKYMHSNNKAKFKTIIDRLFLSKSNFVELIKNKYGNFVLENTMKMAESEHLTEIREYWDKNGAGVGSKEKNKILKLMKDVVNC